MCIEQDVQKIYHAVAAGCPKEEILLMIYDVFGGDLIAEPVSPSCNLRPPADEIRLAARLKQPERAHG